MDKTLETQLQEIENVGVNQDVRDARRLSVTQVAHQGDVYLHRVPDDWPRGDELGTRQIAIGDTQGSRHVIEGDNVTVYEGRQLPETFKPPGWLEGMDPRDIFLGPVVVASTDAVLTHPEHAHHKVCGAYQVTYQADARARERVRD